MRKILSRALIALFLAMMLVSGGMLIHIFRQYAAAGHEYDLLAQSFAPPAARAATSGGSALREIDWNGLRAKSPDAVAWLVVDALDGCDYPVMHTTDNEYYLTHGPDGGESSSGALFLNAACAADFSDVYYVIYGHNMKNGSMFGALKKYATEDFYQKNGGSLTLYTPQGAAHYEIFSVEYVSATEPSVYAAGYTPGSEYLACLQAMQSRSLYETGVAIDQGSRVLTLSTCSYNENTRFVVHAVQTKFYKL